MDMEEAIMTNGINWTIHSSYIVILKQMLLVLYTVVMMEITVLSKLNRYDVKTLTNYNRLVFFETNLKQI